MRWSDSGKNVFLILHNLLNPVCRVMQRLHESQPVRIINRAIQNLIGAGLGDWNITGNIIEDGSVNSECAGRNRHQQRNVAAEISKLACATGRTVCGKIIGQDNVVNAAKCIGGVVVAVSTSCLAVGPGFDAVFRTGREIQQVVRAEETTFCQMCTWHRWYGHYCTVWHSYHQELGGCSRCVSF